MPQKKRIDDRMRQNTSFATQPDASSLHSSQTSAETTMSGLFLIQTQKCEKSENFMYFTLKKNLLSVQFSNITIYLLVIIRLRNQEV